MSAMINADPISRMKWSIPACSDRRSLVSDNEASLKCIYRWISKNHRLVITTLLVPQYFKILNKYI